MNRLARPRKGCSFSIRIAEEVLGPPVTKDERERELIGKPRIYRMRGFSLVHAPDTEANTDGRAFLFAKRHIVELKGRNPRQATLWCRGWVRNRCVSESYVWTGQHRRRW